MNHETIDLNPLQDMLHEHHEVFSTLERLLITENQKFNLTRLASPQQVRTRHFLDSLAGLAVCDTLAQKQEDPLRVLDIGSGAGFPVLAMAVVRPQWSFVSLEATEKKVLFQKKVCQTLKLKNVQVIHGRAEELAHQPPFREKFDVVTARALADLSILAELTLAFLRQDGLALFWKGAAVAEELEKAQGAIRQMGGEVEQLASYMLQTENEAPADFVLIVCKKNRPTPKIYPRVFGVIKKNPLNNVARASSP
jgi:16S rRNA (guanine527-N7)-methyltransferase